MPIAIHNLTETFAVMTPSMTQLPVAVSPDLYHELDKKFAQFKNHALVAAHEFGEDWATWEVHPAGDELVLLLAGSVTFVLRTKNGDEEVRLEQPGSYIIVPRGVWHTARVSQLSRVLFITPGEGTDNSAEPGPVT